MPVINASRRTSNLPSVVFILLIANALVFLAQGAQEALLTYHFALWPVGTPEQYAGYAIPQFQIWQLVSYGFLHGNLTHLFFNLFALWMFGTPMENAWGSRAFALYYFVCVIGAGLVQLLVVSTGVDSMQDVYPTVGASGGVFGILLAFGMTFPNRIIMLIFPPIPLKAKWFVLGYGLLELFLGVTGTQQGVAHFAHLGGMAFGFFLILHWRSRARSNLPPPDGGW